MINKKAVCILIPALNPDEKLPKYIDSLLTAGFKNIIIINDGSDNHLQYIFDEIKKFGNESYVYIYTHAVNLGKGRALKNGINYYLVHLKDKYAECKGLITVDSDGQHLIDDVSKISDILESGKSDVIWGCRDFSMEHVPPKSRFGNQMTRTVIKLLFGKKITDTQTGLRGFSNKVLWGMIELYGERFEYETNVLIDCIKKNLPIEEITIDTVYEDNNSGTHFRPIVDSFKIYRLIFKQFFTYIIVSLSSFVLDCTLFWLLCGILSKSSQIISSGSIWAATIGARCISSLYNYFMNKYVVFDHKEKEFRTLVQYFLLCVIIMLASAYSVSALYILFGFNEVIIKCVVDTLLFCASYYVQNRLIFSLNNETGD